MVPDRPLRFSPLFRSYLWGGRRLAEKLKKAVPADGIWAESWEIVDHGPDQSLVSDGAWEGWSLRQLIESFPEEILGPQASVQPFPLLLKYLDCSRVLSVQVHPNDEYALRLPNPDRGKTEAWYVVDALPGSKVYAGLQSDVTPAMLRESLDRGTIESLLHVLEPQVGDCIFIPAGTVHALGAGLLVAEIQQASDTTFRLYDWNRVDSDGMPRQLHIEHAMEVIDFDLGPVNVITPSHDEGKDWETLVACDSFQLQCLRSSKTISLPQDSRFRILTVTSGTICLAFDDQEWNLDSGDSLLIPAVHVPIEIRPGEASTLLSATVPSSLGDVNDVET